MKRKSVDTQLRRFLLNLDNMVPIDSVVFLADEHPVNSGSWEDFGVAVISPAFEGMPEDKRKMFLAEYWEPASFYADLMGFTPEEVADFSDPLVRDLLERGECLRDSGVFGSVRREFKTAGRKGRRQH
jgi:hypothetical protein